MKYYMAPMEGITGYVYRNAYHKCFDDIDKYFTPFLVPHPDRGFKTRELRELFPEHNEGITVIPQLLTNRAADFIRTAQEIEAMGYTEINLNLGCPSGTVTAKKKGAGFLGEPQELDRFLETIFDQCDSSISIKSRIGVEDIQEFEELLKIFRRYPMTELILHPRLQKEFYKKTPHMEVFAAAAETMGDRLVYNGDLFSTEDMKQLEEKFPGIHGMMLGRGLLAHPGMIQQYRDGYMFDKKKLRQFHDMLLAGYSEMLSGDRNILFRMKEVWYYLGFCFENRESYAKKLRKVQTLSEYTIIVDGIFRDLILAKDAWFVAP